MPSFGPLRGARGNLLPPNQNPGSAANIIAVAQFLWSHLKSIRKQTRDILAYWA